MVLLQDIEDILSGFCIGRLNIQNFSSHDAGILDASIIRIPFIVRFVFKCLHIIGLILEIAI